MVITPNRIPSLRQSLGLVTPSSMRAAQFGMPRPASGRCRLPSQRTSFSVTSGVTGREAWAEADLVPIVDTAKSPKCRRGATCEKEIREL